MASYKFWLGVAAAFGATAVALGALGAHALKQALPPEKLAAFETGVRFQMYHAFFLLALGVLAYVWPNQGLFKWAGWLAVAGTLCFSGSIYLLAGLQLRLGMFALVTPLGGLLLIAAWVVLLLGCLGLERTAQIPR